MTSTKLNDRFIYWSDKKFREQHDYIMFLFECIDDYDLFNIENGLALVSVANLPYGLDEIPFSLYKERYLNNDDLETMARELSIHLTNLTDCFDFGLFELKMCRKMEQVIDLTDELIHELSKRNERKKMRKIYDMMEKLDNDIADVRNVLSRFRPALNYIKRRNQSSQMQNDQLWKPTASPLVKTANPKQLEESLMTL